eukprot:7032904-Pyramimonas_sp.AAC.1
MSNASPRRMSHSAVAIPRLRSAEARRPEPEKTSTAKRSRPRSTRQMAARSWSCRRTAGAASAG